MWDILGSGDSFVSPRTGIFCAWHEPMCKSRVLVRIFFAVALFWGAVESLCFAEIVSLGETVSNNIDSHEQSLEETDDAEEIHGDDYAIPLSEENAILLTSRNNFFSPGGLSRLSNGARQFQFPTFFFDPYSHRTEAVFCSFFGDRDVLNHPSVRLHIFYCLLLV